ncbi:ParB/RepB/Spo0J family partition protein [Rhizobium sp. PP-CC-3G-465]|uniref:ParB/RepB/Spo0J family partition protein n=1 Tax=Rhizobium sp. PP-CC-3G-465 TaxID=2135648 RepID=UPI00104E44AF|nr:ParB family chromosome partitioning protein [Rhizobium sp. PP-CC-3G-465]
MNIETMSHTIDAGTFVALTIQNEVQAIPLARLMPSKANVRRVNGSANVSELADSIEAHGLLHNLTVRQGKKGKYEVVAGSRRLAALRLLAREGRLASDTEIPCNIRHADNDIELSLAENVQREPMHIVDEILAFRELAEGGMPVEIIASRFGQSVITVRQRLKLADLSPKLLDVMRDDGLGLEQARALAISDSHEAQEGAWFDSPAYLRDARNLRALLTHEHVRGNDRLVKFVSIEAYEAAGGGILRDLFADETSIFLTDQPLLTQLAISRLDGEVAAIQAEGWKWVEESLDPSVIYRCDYGRIYPHVRSLSDDEQATIDALGERASALREQLEAYVEGDEAIEADEAELRVLEDKIGAAQDAARTYGPDEQAFAGALVYIDHGGDVAVARGLVKAEDKSALDRLRRGDLEQAESLPSPTATPAETGYSAVLVEELTAIRTAAMRTELAHRPHVALAALLYPLVGRIFLHGFYSSEAAVEIIGQQRALAASLKVPGESRALGAWEAMKEAWGDILPGDSAALWAWLLEQGVDKLLELLAFVTAANLNAVKSKQDSSTARLAHADRIATAIELDMRDHWTADEAFLSRLSKAEIGQVLEEVGCATQAIRGVEKGPKAEAVVEAANLIAGKGWLPSILRSETFGTE